MANKLELTWYGKENRVVVEPRLLLEDNNLSNCRDGEACDNMLIHGDNLLALKALEKSGYAGKIKCIYIDPPYNIRVANPNYDDNLEHSQWLNLMRARIEILWKLLADDGLLAVQIDDEELPRLYWLMIEICGENNLKLITVKMSEPTGVKMASVNRAGSIAKLKEYILLAKKDGIRNLNVERIPKDSWDYEYKTYCANISDEDLVNIKRILDNEERTQNDIEYVDKCVKDIVFLNINEACKKETGKSATEDWLYSNANRIIQVATLTGGARDLAIEKKKSLGEVSAFSIVTKQGKMYIIKGGFNTETKLSRCKFLFADQYLTVHAGDLWTDIKTTGLDNEGGVDFKNSKKPERLIKRIIMLNTKEGDFVLDSFLGSGTTAAVAHKMNRKWIGIELGEHAYSHCKQRIDMVIEGEQGGISKAVNWHGGGAYKFYELAPTLINKDVFDEPIINKEYNPDMLAAAVAMHEGCKYEPNQEVFWKQARASENSYLFVTTRCVTHEFLATINETMKEDEFLVIACKSFVAGADRAYSNIKVKKIPQMLLDNCEFGKDNYNLNIVNPPVYEDDEEVAEDD